jgi:hypothetical protein
MFLQRYTPQSTNELHLTNREPSDKNEEPRTCSPAFLLQLINTRFDLVLEKGLSRQGLKSVT